MKKKINYIINFFTSKELGILPSGLAFSFVLAVIPILSLFFYLVTSINVSADFIMNLIEITFPKGVVTLLQPVFIEEFSMTSLFTIIFGLIVTVNGCNSIILASNTIYDIENAPYIKRIIKSLLLTLLIILLLMFVVIVPLFGNSILNFLMKYSDFISSNEAAFKTLYLVLQVPIAILVVFLLVKAIYVISPDQKVPTSSINKGTIFTTISWLLLTAGFSYYINNIARYDLVYGNLANVVMLMLWFYFLAYILVIGMIINKKIVNDSIDKTNTIKLEEIRKKIKEEKVK